MSRPECTFLYVHGASIGYGRLGVKLAEALTRAGVDVYDDLGDPAEELPESYRLVARGRRTKRTNAVCWVSVPTHARGWWEGQHISIFTMWEATQLPESFRQNLHNFDQVFVPSLHNVELFSHFHDNVNYIPLGIDPADWYHIPRTEPTTTFNFLIGGSGKRKGTDLAYRAFQTVFGKWWNSGEYVGPLPAPRLVMKNPKSESYYAPFTDMVTGRLSAEEEIDLYSQAHVYLQPSRGEGFGLQPLQALAQGIPTILTNAHGQAAFAHLGIPLSTTYEPADYFIYGDAGNWWLPDFDELCEAMWECYANYAPQLTRAADNARIVNKMWTWDHTARELLDVYGDVLTRAPVSDTAPWVKPSYRKYHVRVSFPVSCDIAGLTYQFMPGRDYYEQADVKRILFEAGQLDPACLTVVGEGGNMEFDLGLTDKQLARLGDYSAAHSYCHACGQRMNSVPTRAEDMYAEMGGDL